ncbi:MAG: hypothetical protein ACTSPV_03005 [Candidatus Hodarchaeales archaeon]
MKKWSNLILLLSLALVVSSTVLAGIHINTETEITSNSQVLQPLVNENRVQSFADNLPRASIQGTFPEPTVEIISFTDHEMQLTGYGNDTLRFSMEFKPTQTAFYYANAYLYTNTSSNQEQLGSSVYWGQTITGGTTTVATFDFCAYLLHDKNIDGPYAIYLEFYKDNGSLFTIYGHEYVHETKSYLATDFLGAPVTLTAISVNFIDNDGNSRYEWIDFILSVNVTVPGNYRFEGYIQDPNYGINDYAVTYPYLDTGSTSVTLRFRGWNFADLTSSSTVKLEYLSIAHNDYPNYIFLDSWNTFYESSTIYPTDFDVPPVILTGKFTDNVFDENGDGVYEEYWVTVEINRTRIEDGTVGICASLYVNSSMYYIENKWSDAVTLDTTGLMNVTFKFNGFYIYESGILDDMFRLDSIYGNYYHNDGNYADDINYNYFWVSSQTYIYSDFTGPGASLTGNITDMGVDKDADGLYDLLVVEVEVNVTSPSYYYISASIEIASSWVNIGYASNSTYLAAGKHWIQLVYDGPEIFKSGLDDTITLRYLYLYDETLAANIDSIDSLTLGYYIFSQFDPPKAWFTGIYSDAVFDDDSDGLWDGMKIYVEVEINDSSRYCLIGSLRNPVTGDSYWAESEPQYLSTGTLSMVLSFDGQWIWRQHTNTTYILDYVRIEEIDEFDSYIRSWDEVWDAYVTNVTNSDDFEHPKAYFTGNINESRIDTDSDGDYDYLVLSVEVYYNESVNLRLDGNLYTGLDWIYSTNQTTSNQTGFVWLKLRFPSTILYSLNTNSSYEVNLDIYDDDSGMNLDSIYGYITNVYPWMEWNPPGLVFSGKIYDRGVDNDNNGKFDYIELQIEVDVDQEGLYYLYGYIRADDGGSDYYFSWGYNRLYVGTYNITIEIDLSWVRGHSNGTMFYLDTLEVYEDTGSGYSYRIGLYEDDIYFANIYYHEDFDLPEASVLGIIDDYGVDYNSDGFYDDWVVVFLINVTVNNLDLYLEAGLEEISTNNYITTANVYVYNLSIGVYNITLEFSGIDLYNSNFLNGAQIYYYRLIRSYDWQTLDESWEVQVLSHAYSWSDFNPSPASYVSIKSVTPMTGSLFYIDDPVNLEVTIEHSNDEWITSVSVKIEVDDVYETIVYLSSSYTSDTEDIWTVTLTLDHGSKWDLEITAFGSTLSDKVDITYYLFGAPFFYDFTVNVSSVTLGGTVHFEADVWDASGFSSVTLYVAGSSYSMNYFGNSTYGMLYTVDVTFNSVGEFSAFVNATNIYGLSTKSFTRTIYVNEGSEVLSVTVSPSSSIELGESITFTVVIRKSDAIITSVSLKDDIEGTTYALEKSLETNENETWTVTYTPTKAGQHVCTITVLNTRNQVSNHEEIFNVTGGTTLNLTPGFEFIFPVIMFSVLYLIRNKRKRL